jgi:hypothetical protein
LPAGGYVAEIGVRQAVPGFRGKGREW